MDNKKFATELKFLIISAFLAFVIGGAGLYYITSAVGGLEATARAVFLDGDLEQTARLYGILASEHPDDWLHGYNAGVANLSLGDTASAIETFGAAHRSNPKTALPLLRIAQIEYARGNGETAESLLKSALALEKNHLESMTLLAEVLLSLDRIDEAGRYAERAFKMKPASVPARIVLAKTIARKGDRSRALRVIQEGIEVFPRSDLLMIAYELAESLGDSTAMNTVAETYLEHHPNNPLRARFGIPQKKLNLGDNPLDAPATDWIQTRRRYHYKGSWGPFGLGKLILEVDAITKVNGRETFPIRYRVISNPLLGIIKVDDQYISYITTDLKGSLRFESRARETWWVYDRSYFMNPDIGEIRIHSIDAGGVIAVNVQAMPERLVDGTSLLAIARKIVKEQKGVRVQTIIDEDYVWTNIVFAGKSEKLKILGQVRDTWIVEGFATFTGVAGMSGNFKGWFSTDGQALPLKGAFKIFIGSIVLEYDGEEEL